MVKTFYFKFTVQKKDEEQSLNRCDVIGSQRNLLGYENKCTRLWNPKYGKISIMESGILGFGIRNTAQGIRNPSNNWNQNPSSTDKYWNPVPGIRNPQRGIQNPRLSQFFLLRMKLVQCSSRKQPTFRDATHWFPREMTSEKRAQKFHTDDVSPSRSG